MQFMSLTEFLLAEIVGFFPPELSVRKYRAVAPTQPTFDTFQLILISVFCKELLWFQRAESGPEKG